MSELTPVIDYIDGAARRIYLLQGVDTFHWIEDVYREYIDRRMNNEELRKFFPLMRQAGNDPKGGGKYTPRYVTLLQGCRVVPYDENILIEVNGEAITDNADVDPDPFDTSTRTQAVKLYITPPASELVKAADELIAINRMAFNEVITVNVDNGTSGTTWPTGTLGQPVDNLADALLIAEINDIGTMSIVVDTLIDSGGDYRALTFIGASKTKTELTVSDAAQVDNCEFYDCHIKGVLDGDSTLHGCVIDDLNYVTGFIEQCVLDAGTILLGSGATAHFLDCWSGVPGTETPTIDMGGAGQSLAMRNYNGGIKIKNKTGSESVSIDLNSGQVKIDLATVTDGTIVIRGIGKVIEATTGEYLPTGYYGDLYILNEAMSKENISIAVWDEAIGDHLVDGTTGRSIGIQQFGGTVTLDVVNGNAGTAFPIGTSRVPVNNIPDAIAIAANNGLNSFTVKGELTASGGPFAGYTVYGDNTQDTIINCVDLNCQGVTFEKCTVTGNFINDSYIIARECVLTDVLNVEIIAYSTSFGGAVRLIKSVGGKSVFYDCYDNVPGIGVPDIQVHECDELGIWNFNGGIRLSTITTPGTIISCMIAQGRLWVDETCVEGDIIVKGMADLRGETAGTTIDQDGLITGDKIAEFVLDANITTHQDHDTVGFVFMQLSYADKVFVEVGSGNTGTDYPVGTEEHPVDNIDDALALMAKYSCSILHPHSDITLESNHVLDHYIVQGHGNLVTVNSAITNYTRFQNVSVTGTLNGKCNFDTCQLSNLSGMFGRAENCVLAGTLTMVSGKTQIMTDCNAVDLAGPIFDMDGGATMVTTGMSGRLTTINLTTGVLGIGGDFCQVVLDATCSGGVAAIGTKGTLIDNSTGTVVPLVNTLNLQSIADGVWGYERA